MRRPLPSLRISLNCSLAIILVGLILMPCGLAWAAKPKADAAKAEAKAETAKPDFVAPKPLSGPPLPTNLNDASLRLHAIDTMYELDLSVEQLKQLRKAATGTASVQHRSAAKGNPKLIAAMRDFQSALLDGKDNDQIDSLRTQVADSVDDETVHLDDGIQITDAARTKAPDVFRQFTASQIAAFLASHADEVGDPVEMMMNTVDELRDQRASAAADKDSTATDATDKTAADKKKEAGESNSDADDAAALIDVTANDVANLVAGLDEAKSKAMSANVAKWLKTTSEMKDDEFTTQRSSLEAAAKTLVGNVHPMRVLDCWLEHQVAELLSNPQLTPSIDAIIRAKEPTN